MLRDIKRRERVLNRVKRVSLVVYLKKVFPFLILLLIIILSFPLGFWDVKSFEYTNRDLENVSKEQLDSYLEQFKGKNIFLLKPDNVKESLLESNGYIQEVYIKKVIPSKLEITIKEHIPYYLGYSSDSCLLFSKGGILIEKVCEECDNECFGSEDISRVRITSDQNLEANKKLIFLEEFDSIVKLFEELGYVLNSINITEGIVTILDDEQHQFVFDITYDLDIQLGRWYLVAQKIDSEMIEFKSVDMRFERPVMVLE
jgi:hypothetical protein